MKREYKRDLNSNYMILSNETANTMDDYRVRMLISNKIPFILKCNVRKFDGSVKYYYEITSKHPMKRIYDKKKIGRIELNTLITSFLKVLESSSEYLLNPNDFILDPDYIYMNIETNQVYFCYMPGYEKDISESFHTLTSYILERIDHEDKHTVATAYELYRQTMNDNYSLRDILNSITQEDSMEYENLKESKSSLDIDELAFQLQEKNEEEKNNKEIKPKTRLAYALGGFVILSALLLLSYFLYMNIEVIKSIQLSNDLLLKAGGFTLIILVIITYIIYKKQQLKNAEESDNLIVLNEEKNILPEQEYEKPLNQPVWKDKIRQEKKEVVANNQPSYRKDIVNHEMTFYESTKMQDNTVEEETQNYGNTVLLNYRSVSRKLIASKEKYMNFELSEKNFLIGKMAQHVDGIIQDELISRIHAEVEKRDTSYYLTDLNSTNGTFLNGRRLEANETVEIHSDDVICFATVEYVFR